MMTRTLIAIVTTITFSSLSGVCPAQDHDERVRLRDEIDTIRHEQIKQLIVKVLQDADTRTSLLTQELQAGYDHGFFIGSSDGNFLLKLSGQLQSRFVINSRDRSGGDDTLSGFENRRVKVSFGGHLIDPSIKYAASVDIGRSGLASLSEAYIQKIFDNGLRVKVGQFKPPFLREELISSKRMLTAERSLVNDSKSFNQDRSLGLQLEYGSERTRGWVMFHNGFGQKNQTSFTNNTEFAITARGEWLLDGQWKTFQDFTSPIGEEFSAMIGGAISWERDESGAAGVGPRESRFNWTTDVSLEFGGASLFAAVMGQHTNATSGPTFDRYGFVIQGGKYIADDLELFGRYEWGDADSPGDDDLSIITIGFNKFFKSHSLKWTTDIGFAFNEVTSDWAVSKSDWAPDAARQDGQIVIRSQLQLLF